MLITHVYINLLLPYWQLLHSWVIWIHNVCLCSNCQYGSSKLKHTCNQHPALVNFVFEQIQQLANFCIITFVGKWKRWIWLGVDTDMDAVMVNFKIHFYIYTTLIFHNWHFFYCSICFQTLASTFYPFISAGAQGRLSSYSFISAGAKDRLSSYSFISAGAKDRLSVLEYYGS